jgi:hypothetical protein
MTAKALFDLAAVCSAAALVFAAPAYLWGGAEEAARVLAAFAVCLPPAAIALVVVAGARDAAPARRLVAVAFAAPIRVATTLAVAALVWCVILSPKAASFWLWIVVAYAVTLAADVRLMLRVLRDSRPSLEHSAGD